MRCMCRTVGNDSNRHGPAVLIHCSLYSPRMESAEPRHCRLHKEAFNHAWRTIFHLDTDIDTMKHHGLTDPLILVSMLEHHGTPRQEVR